ncbi:MAG: hypothetical protein JNK85_01900 [Verrucomicrobiales bacterium]|nr:hypothetical protein [Verrucomicrobiales bacterium]
MNLKRHGLIVLCLAGIATASGLAGGVVGFRLGRQAMRELADPEAWHSRALRRFDEVVQPTPEQSQRVSTHLEAALADLRKARQTAIDETTRVIHRLVNQVEAELTPAQREAFQELKPRREDMTLDVLDVKQ